MEILFVLPFPVKTGAFGFNRRLIMGNYSKTGPKRNLKNGDSEEFLVLGEGRHPLTKEWSVDIQ